MRLKPAGIIVIVLIIAALAYFALKPRLTVLREENSTDYTTNTIPAEEKEAPPKDTSDTGKATTAERRDFNYTPEKPVNGVLKGVVEVGAAGFNSFVINMDDQNRWEIVSKDFGESLAYEGLATTDDIRAGLKKYLSSMFAVGIP